MRYIILFFVIVLSTTSSAQSPVAKVEWLNGSWQGTYQGKPFYEAWRKLNENMMINFTIEINGKDSIVQENGVIRIEKQGGSYRGRDAKWEISTLTDSAIILKNDTLKYSNFILWQHTSAGHWWTEIKNPNGKIITYDLIKVDWPEMLIDKYILNAGKKP